MKNVKKLIILYAPPINLNNITNKHMSKITNTIKKPNLYLSFDIESDGCTPILHNMISIGFYGLDDNLVKHFEYDANIENLEGHSSEEKCMTTFWNLPENQVAWNYLQQNKKKYIDVMFELSNHFKALSETHKLIFVAARLLLIGCF